MKQKNSLTHVLCALLLMSLSSVVTAAEFTVDKTFDGADANPGDGVCGTATGSCTLRAAVMETNALAGADVIKIKPGTYKLALGTTGDNDAASGDLDISDDLTIIGEDRDTVILSGNDRFRIFQVSESISVMIEGVTFIEGRVVSGSAISSSGKSLKLRNILVAGQPAGEAAIYQSGGFILVIDSEFTNNNEVFWLRSTSAEFSNNTFSENKSRSMAITNSSKTITINDTSFISNTGDAPVYSSASRAAIYITSTIFEDNESSRNGGAIRNEYGYYYIVDTVFKNNSSSDKGGAIYSYVSNFFVAGSRFENNSAVTRGGAGGAIYLGARTAIDIYDTVFDANSAGDRGGAVAGSGRALSLTRTKLSTNTSGVNGGAVYNSGNVFIRNSVVSDNTAAGEGGGILTYGGSIQNSEISGNSAPLGGGVYNFRNNLLIKNTTVTGNSASDLGGGIYNKEPALDLVNVTLASNGATNSGGNIFNTDGSTVRQINTIIANASGSDNCAGLISTLGFNIDTGDTCGLGAEGDQSNTDPLLLALADNGGSTQTMALDTGSPAIDAGLQNKCDELNSVDQRFNYRTDDSCDIGAFEADSVRAESGLIQFELIEKTVNEYNSDFTFTVSRTDGSESAGSAWLSIARTSTEKGNYTFTNQRLSWADGESDDKEITVTLSNDNNKDGNKTLVFTLTDPLEGISIGDKKELVVTIMDDESIPGEISIEEATYSFSEDSYYSISIPVIRSNGNAPVDVTYTTSDGTAVAGTDYTESTGTLTFNPNETTKNIVIDLRVGRDNIFDGDKDFTITLSNPTDGATLGTWSSALVTIDDSTDFRPGTFSVSNVTVGESDGTATITVTRSGGSDLEAKIDYATSNIQAISGEDYTAVSGTLTFANGETEKTIVIAIIDDQIAEPAEGFKLTLSNPVSAGLSYSASSTVTISATPTGSVSFDGRSVSVSESEGKVDITLNRTGGDEGELEVKVSTRDRSALATQDFTALSDYVVKFSHGETSKVVTIDLVNDAVIESNEYFDVLLANRSFRVIIENDDTNVELPTYGKLGFTSSVKNINENKTSLNLTVKRTDGSDGSVSIDYVTEENTATEGSDYTATSGTLTFAAGETSKIISIDISNDVEVESTETFSVILSNPQGGATLGTSELSVSIADNDEAAAVVGTGTLNLENSTYTVNEGAGELDINVKRTAGSTGEVSVLITLSGNAIALGNSPATYLDDYRLNTASQVNFGRLVLSAGVVSRSFKIIIENDTDIENNENFTITLSNPKGGAILGSQIMSIATITDNDTAPAQNPTGNGGSTAIETETESEESSGAVGQWGLLLILLMFLGFRRRTLS